MDTFLNKKIQLVRQNTDEDNSKTEKNSSSSVNASSSYKQKSENPYKKFKDDRPNVKGDNGFVDKLGARE
ncbi:hypothetical protein QTP88_025528 [Uroleucon formosanum]